MKTLREYLDEKRHEFCQEVYYRRNQNMSAAARELEISRTTLYSILFPEGKKP